MIMVGHSRANGQNLARHLMSHENDHVTIHEVSGFASEDLHGAFKEAEAVSRGTRCQKYLYSLSLNPPQDVSVETNVFEDTIKRVEKVLGLQGQPRAVVFHEKENRRHCHVVWSRIDTSNMKAIQLDFPKRKLNALAKDIYLEKGWELPKGFLTPSLRDPKNFTLEEWQQAKRCGKDPREIKAIFQSCWKQSDSRAAFENALSEHCYALAKGDRRGFVAADVHGEVYSLSRYAGVKTKALKAKLGDRDGLPTISQAQSKLAKSITPQLKTLYNRETERLSNLGSSYDRMHKRLTQMHSKQRQDQKAIQEARWTKETKQRQQRFNSGLRGLFDRFTGAYRKTKRQNAFEMYQASLRDQRQRDDLIFTQMEQKRELSQRMKHTFKKPIDRARELKADIERLSKSKGLDMDR